VEGGNVSNEGMIYLAATAAQMVAVVVIGLRLWRARAANERLVRACNYLEPWVAEALESWEGGPMPSENLGKRLYYEFLDALQKVNRERGDAAAYTIDAARAHAWRDGK